MTTVFVDTLYLIALVDRNDPWRNACLKARTRLGDAALVTTDEVLTEFLTAMSGFGEGMRRATARMARHFLSHPRSRVIGQTRRGFLEGLWLYENRQDKEYSMTDCISMCAMRANSITEILTNDHHFTQEGFTILVPDHGKPEG